MSFSYIIYYHVRVQKRMVAFVFDRIEEKQNSFLLSWASFSQFKSLLRPRYLYSVDFKKKEMVFCARLFPSIGQKQPDFVVVVIVI